MDMTEEEIFEELTAFFDGNKYAAAGLMGNFWIESHIEPNRLSGNGQRKTGMNSEEYTKAVDDGTYTNFVHDGGGYGLAQLTYYAKKQGLLDLARETNQSVGSARLQIAHLEKELEDRPELLHELKNADSAWDAGVRFMMGYEGPADQSDENQDNRGNIAEEYYEMYKHLDGSGASGNLLDEIYIDFEKINDITSTLESKIKSINITSIDVASAFSSLTSLGIATGLVSSLKAKLISSQDAVLNACHNLFNTVDEQKTTDIEFNNREINVTEKGRGGYYRNGGGGYDGGGEDLVNGETSVDNSSKDLSIKSSFTNKVLTLDGNSFSSLMLTLYKLPGGLLKYLETPEFAEDLKKEILNSPNLSNELKEAILKMDPLTLRVELLSILGNTNMLSDSSKRLIYSYLNYTGNKNVLLSNIDKYLNAGKEIMDGDTSKELLELYDGDSKQDKDTTDFYRLSVDMLADEKGVTPEALLTGEAHKIALQKEMSNTIKALSYIDAVKGLGDSTVNNTLNSIVTGGMYK